MKCGGESDLLKSNRMDWLAFKMQCPEDYEKAKGSFEMYQKLYKNKFQKGRHQ
jgi:hypothetical protein